jgi:hypothetical protein
VQADSRLVSQNSPSQIELLCAPKAQTVSSLRTAQEIPARSAAECKRNEDMGPVNERGPADDNPHTTFN